MKKRLFSFLVAGFLLMGIGCFNSECFAAPSHHKNNKATHQRNVKQSPHVKKAKPAPKKHAFSKKQPKKHFGIQKNRNNNSKFFHKQRSKNVKKSKNINKKQLKKEITTAQKCKKAQEKMFLKEVQQETIEEDNFVV